MDPGLDLPKASTCTSCKFKENRSNYWTAVMFFKHPNGSFIRVPQIENHVTGLPNGGMTVYYIQPPTDEKVTAFPKVSSLLIFGASVKTRHDSMQTLRVLICVYGEYRVSEWSQAIHSVAPDLK